MNKALFLDRDGVINDGSAYYTYKIEDFIFNDDVLDALLLMQNNGYLLIVITNQSGVAKGEYSIEDVQRVHEYMQSECGKLGVIITDVFVCPHHPSIKDCKCRKPKNALFVNAIEKYSIDVTKSYMIGDSERDIIAALSVGVKGIKVNKNESILQYCKQIVEHE